ncbi:cell wall protein DAN4-like isoform X2 [Penaeus japonicus]|uniref:cell wall protein DAN4-like isoform X2 n=1 Tax=Penaeus japonicus TaxID=27405 RepID=UPI001C70C8B6|nr:cell wall protein DAN4-like isoform X2 [Penaeus japonicus]
MFINHLKKVQCNRSERLDDPGMALIFSLVVILAVSSLTDSQNGALDASSYSELHTADVTEAQDELSPSLFTNSTDTSAAANTSQNPTTSSAVSNATDTSDGTSATSPAPSSPNTTDSTTSATTNTSTVQPTSSPTTTPPASQTTSTSAKPTSPTTTRTTSTTSATPSSSPDVTPTVTTLKPTTGIPPTPITTTPQPSTTTVPPAPPHPGLSVALSLFILLAVILIIGAGVWWIRRRRQLERLRHQLMPMYNFDPTDDADDWENQLLEEERSLRPEAEKVQMYSGNSTFDTSQKAPAGATQKD